ncbi:MAG: hypothetical protein GY725_21055, partial [bacterium]|nr:hypothetical protein [bacterium]
EGSIHDDATASKLGFRGGTVAGNIHMDQFVPVLVEAFGNEWFETGHLSLRFLNATTDREIVRAHVTPPADPKDPNPVEAWMLREDGLEVARGSAGIGDISQSALHQTDLRSCDPKGLRILQELRPGEVIGSFEEQYAGKQQQERLEKGWISDPLAWYSGPSPWGGSLASPSALVELLWFAPTEALRAKIGRSVGLFGSIEVAHTQGPVFLDQAYSVSSEVISLGESPKTEIIWFDSAAKDDEGRTVATMRMQLRFMKASSELYSA